MTELTRRCLDLSKASKEKLIKVLTDSLNEEEREDDGSRFSVLYKIATDICGNGILSNRRDFNLVIGRRLIAYKMRKEGYSLSTIGKHMYRHHASILHAVRMLQDAIDWKFQPEFTLWETFNEKLKEYENESKAV